MVDNVFDKIFYVEGDHIGGVDDSGVVDIAGPLVAACVVLPRIDVRTHDLKIFEVFDSKQTPKRLRKRQAEVIWQTAIAIGIGEVQPSELDYFSTQQSQAIAMLRAVRACKHVTKHKHIRPDFLLVDGDIPVPVNIKQATIRRLDEKSLCCAAASIIAKVYRDEIMTKLHETYPYYGWASNKGFPSEEHLRGIDQYGLQIGVHRLKWWPIRANSRFPDGKETWDVRRRKWRQTTFKKLGMDIGEEQWSLDPPLWQHSESFKPRYPEEGKFTSSMKDSKNESIPSKTTDSSPTCSENS